MNHIRSTTAKLVLAATLAVTAATGCERGTDDRTTPVANHREESPTTTGDGHVEETSLDSEAVQQFHRPGELVSQWSNMAEYLQFVVESVDSYWTAAYRAGGLSDPYVNVRWMSTGEQLTMKCVDSKGSSLTTDRTAAYCGSDDTIYISQKFAVDLWSGSFKGSLGQQFKGQDLGDFAVALVVAHEYAHQVQKELGITPARIGKQNHEQQADCLAGVWAKAAEQGSMLDPGDLEEAVRATWLFADDGSSHGTMEQRAAAFALGYKGGQYASCAGYAASAR